MVGIAVRTLAPLLTVIGTWNAAREEGSGTKLWPEVEALERAWALEGERGESANVPWEVLVETLAEWLPCLTMLVMASLTKLLSVWLPCLATLVKESLNKLLWETGLSLMVSCLIKLARHKG